MSLRRTIVPRRLADADQPSRRSGRSVAPLFRDSKSAGAIRHDHGRATGDRVSLTVVEVAPEQESPIAGSPIADRQRLKTQGFVYFAIGDSCCQRMLGFESETYRVAHQRRRTESNGKNEASRLVNVPDGGGVDAEDPAVAEVEANMDENRLVRRRASGACPRQ